MILNQVLFHSWILYQFAIFIIIELFLFFSFQNASPDVCKVLVGNKIDCDDERVIDTDKGKSVGLIFFTNKEQFWSHKLFKAIHLEAYILQVNPRHCFKIFIILFRCYIAGSVLVQEMLNSDNFDEMGRSCKLMSITLNENTERGFKKSQLV